MKIVLTVIIIFLILLVWFMVSTECDLHKKYKDLQKKYSELRAKYETQKFELKKIKDKFENINSELLKDFFDSEYWIKRSFENRKECNNLKAKLVGIEDLKYKIFDDARCKIIIKDEQINEKAKTEYELFIRAIIKNNFDNFEYLLKQFSFLLDSSRGQQLQYVTKNKKAIIEYIKQYLYFEI